MDQGLFPNAIWMRLPDTMRQQEREDSALCLSLVLCQLHCKPESKTVTHLNMTVDAEVLPGRPRDTPDSHVTGRCIS